MFLVRSPSYLSETQRAIIQSLSLIDAGAHLPAFFDFASILMSDHGLRYLQSICPSFDITEIEELSPPGQWISACLVRTMSACYEIVIRRSQGYPRNAIQSYISTERLTNKIKDSHGSLRRCFLLSLSVGGSASMLEPLLFHGLSIGDLSTYFCEKAAEHGRLDMAYLWCSYGAFLSQETSIRLLKHMEHDIKTVLLKPRESQVFRHVLERALKSCGNLQEFGDEHAIFGPLVRIFQNALLPSKSSRLPCSKFDSGDHISNTIVRLLLRAGLFQESKLPTNYWSFDLRLLTNDGIYESPLTLAMRVHNTYTIKILIQNGNNVNEVYRQYANSGDCMTCKGKPLIYAIWLGFAEVVTILLEAGADVTTMGTLGQTAPELAKVCLSRPKAAELEDCESDMESRQRIFTMVCANLANTHDKSCEDFLDTVEQRLGSLASKDAGTTTALFGLARNELILADLHPPLPRYWRKCRPTCSFCSESIYDPGFHFA